MARHRYPFTPSLFLTCSILTTPLRPPVLLLTCFHFSCIFPIDACISETFIFSTHNILRGEDIPICLSLFPSPLLPRPFLGTCPCDPVGLPRVGAYIRAGLLGYTTGTFLVHSIPPEFSFTCRNTCLVQHSTWATFVPTRSLQRFFILPDAHQTLVLIPTSQAQSRVVEPLLPTPFGFPLHMGAWRTCRQLVFILVSEGVRVSPAHGSILWRVCHGLVHPSQLLHVDACYPEQQLIL